jgi:glycosyltransferase involved in cell wall biosynthesis
MSSVNVTNSNVKMSRRQILYITHMRLPTEKAYGVQMANTVYHFAREGCPITLVTTQHKNSISKSLMSYYGIPENAFSIVYIPSLTWWWGTRVGFWINMLSFSVSCLWRYRGVSDVVIYSREPFPLLLYALLGYTTIYEMHDFPKAYHWFHTFLCRRVTHVVVTNVWALERAHSKYGVPNTALTCAPNGFSDHVFTGTLQKEEARVQLHIPSSKHMVVYSGALLEWKGVPFLIEVAKHMPEIDLWFIGGSPQVHEDLRMRGASSNCVFVPHMPQGDIPRYLAAADAVVLPNIPSNQHSTYSTSPIKLFEYLASRRPIVASDLPSIRSLVDDSEVVFVEAGNQHAWVDIIRDVVTHPQRYDARVSAAREKSASYTWRARARTILSVLTKTS